MPLLSLPNELLHQIAESVKRTRDLHFLCLANKRLHDVANPVLYRRDILHRGSKGKLCSSAKALFYPALKNSANTAHHSIAAGADHASALKIAVLSGSQDVALLLLKAGACRRAHDVWFLRGTTLLHLAYAMGLVRVAQKLIEEGMQIDVKNKEAKSPLLYAVMGLQPTEERKEMRETDGGNKPHTRQWLAANGADSS